MYLKLQNLEREHKYNRLLIQSIILTALGAHIFGGIALYNAIKLGSALEIFCREHDKDAYNDAIKRKIRCSKLLSIGMFLVVLKYFLIFAMILGGFEVYKENLNYHGVL